MRTQHSRDVFFYDIRVVPDPLAAPRKSMQAIAALIGRLHADRQTVRWDRSNTHKTYLRDFSFDEQKGIMWLLLCSADAHAPGASFMHLETDDQRDEEKRDGEGRPETSHLLIRSTETNAGSSQYLALFEESSRFPRIAVERYLNFLLRQTAKSYKDEYLYPAPSGERLADGKPKMIRFQNSVTVSGHLSNDFKADIKAGTLRGVSLVTSDTTNFGFGETKRLTPVEKQIKLKVSGSWNENSAQLIADALAIGKTNKLEKARIVFATADKVAHTAMIDTENGNVLNDGYIKKVRLNANEIMLPEASRTFVPLLQERMLALMS